jgi:hypothetical protein
MVLEGARRRYGGVEVRVKVVHGGKGAVDGWLTEGFEVLDS